MKCVCIAILLLWVTCMMVQAKDILTIAHRGASGYILENTIAAFQLAIELGADMIELDVWCSVDGQPIVFHDIWLDRLYATHKRIDACTLEELKAISGGQIATLSEVLGSIGGRVKINIELKGLHLDVSAVLSCLAEWVTDGCYQWQDFIISSFNHQLLKGVSELQPAARVAAIFQVLPLDYRVLIQDLVLESIVLDHELTTHELVCNAHEHGLHVYVFTVNYHEDIRQMIELQVDGIISDFPDRVNQDLLRWHD